MHFSLRTKLVLSFIVVVALLGLVTTWLGMTLIGERIIQQAQEKVRLDLNAAREIYSKKMSAVKDIIRFTSDRFFLKEGIAHADFTTIYDECTRILQDESLDMLTLLDANGVVLYRAHNPSVRGDTLLGRALIQKVMTHTRVTASTETWDVEALGREGEQLRQRAQIEILATPRARPHRIGEVTCGMMLSAAAPVCDRQGVRIGLLYGGVLLNGDYEIVDRIKSTVYQGESYRGRAIGTATIFLDDVRISTNVVDEKDVRAIGTCVSEEVYHHVAIRGLPWIERAFVVNDWYITAYESITDVEDANIGMLYVGMLEAPYRELKSRVLITFLSVTFFSVFILSVITLLIAKRITQPIQKLMRATKKLGEGDLSYRVKVRSRDELGSLADSFNAMAEELQRATNNYLSLSRTLEEKVHRKSQELQSAQDQLVQSEKLSALGKLAAGIAHEINNPLTSILVNSHLIREKDMPANLDPHVQLIIDETVRCSEIVKGLLDFARQTKPHLELSNINEILEETLRLFNSQVMVEKVEMRKEFEKNIPAVFMDQNKIKQVITNLLLNALDAMDHGGAITVRSYADPESDSIKIEVRDTGAGMTDVVKKKIFDPFFTTKGMKGTGLGLAVSYGILQQHGGEIEVESSEGVGTTFTIRLPVRKEVSDEL